MGGKKTEKYRKNVFKRAKTVNVAKSRKNHWYSFGDFGLKICMGHVFLLWLLLECSKAYATKSSESLTELLHFFFLKCLEAVLCTQKNSVCRMVLCL